MTARFCKDCKHCEPMAHYRCNAPENAEIDIVTGCNVQAFEDCYAARGDGGACGELAHWFEPKEAPSQP
jgi:hypothetical protein